MRKIYEIKGEKWIANCYIIHDYSNAVLIDPGNDYKLISSFLMNSRLTPKAILATHGHYDHIINVQQLKQEYKIPFYMHIDDKNLLKHANFYMKLFNGTKNIEIPEIDEFVIDSSELDFGFLKLRVIHTPGHTNGSVCYYFEDHLFSGDLLLKNEIGRTDLPGGSKEKMQKSIIRIVKEFDDINLYPGHNENSKLNLEKKYNQKMAGMLKC